MDESLEKATHAVVARSSAETGATVGYRIRPDRPARINFLSAPTATSDPGQCDDDTRCLILDILNEVGRSSICYLCLT